MEKGIELEGIALFLIILFFVVVIGSISGFVANSRISTLQTEIRILKRMIEGKYEKPPVSDALAPPKTKSNPLPIVDDPIAAKPFEREISDLPVAQAARAVPLQAAKKVEKKSKPGKSEKIRRTFEEELGARWAVWVGGVALFLGAVFLLRYTIEAGFFTPVMRVFMASLFGVGLLAAGEYLRRIDRNSENRVQQFAKSLSENADISGVLTAVGVFTLLGSVYAAYALYDLVGPISAFILLGALSLTALALGLLHGPKLATLGLVASLATPLLVENQSPNAYILFTYLTIIGAAALALAKKRDWDWLNLFTLIGMLGWIFLSIDASNASGTHIAWLGFMGLSYAVSTYLATHLKPSKTLDGPQPKSIASIVYGPLAANVWAAFAAIALFMAAEQNGFSGSHYYAGLAGAGILMLTAWFKPRLSLHILAAGVLASALLINSIDGSNWQWHVATAMVLNMVFIGLCFTRLSVKDDLVPDIARDRFWPIAGVVLPIILMLGLFLTAFQIKDAIAGGAMFLLAIIYAVQVYWLWEKSADRKNPIAIYAIGIGIAYFFAVIIGLSGTPETLGLIAGIVIFAAVTRSISAPVLGMISSGFALLTAINVLFDRIPYADAVGDQIIFNALWFYFVLPGMACALSAWLLTRVRDDLWSEGLKAMTLVFASLFLVFQIRHIMNGGDLLANRFGLDEMAMQVLVGLCFTLGSSLIGSKKLSETSKMSEKLMPTISLGVSALTLTVFGLGVCLGKAPLFNSNTLIKGGVVFNTLLIAYLLPAILLAAIAWNSKNRRPLLYIQVVGGLALAAILHYLTSIIRYGFSGQRISIFRNPPDNVEMYAISAAWLALGIALLVVGIKGRRQDVRMASAIVITLTVFKAFLIDMASLEGVLRAMSFVVLGLVLIVIGRVYQKLLFSQRSV
jgi:uncharacterized membrane protein